MCCLGDVPVGLLLDQQHMPPEPCDGSIPSGQGGYHITSLAPFTLHSHFNGDSHPILRCWCVVTVTGDVTVMCVMKVGLTMFRVVRDGA